MLETFCKLACVKCFWHVFMERMRPRKPPRSQVFEAPFRRDSHISRREKHVKTFCKLACVKCFWHVFMERMRPRKPLRSQVFEAPFRRDSHISRR